MHVALQSRLHWLQEGTQETSLSWDVKQLGTLMKNHNRIFSTSFISKRVQCEMKNQQCCKSNISLFSQSPYRSRIGQITTNHAQYPPCLK